MTPQDKTEDIGQAFLYNDEIEPQYLIKESKFLLLSFLTFGLYPVWWIYKAWVFFIQKEGSNANPAIRVVFNLFFMLALLNRIRRFARQEGYQGSNFPAISYVLIIGVSFCSLFPPPFFLISLSGCLFFLPSVSALNYGLQESSEVCSYEDDGLSARQIILVVIGLVLWGLIVVGLLSS
ncbi:hypothetical protein SAMN05421820_113134 [Pedobacter steynii]|uniref:DUF4234 domain-containing protein n=1 Tax=Pedobacter steynii TaxID=430522 RepID=A0A1H0IF60_9SPHI|nr:hypothetical protein [Pedobacter steynii]NQX42882.1 hypothetical protein [Pedobacter steynii]SDO30032.1 hypothetical protein SAMN05421820_113134 [Pedobacter steynii]